MDETSGRTILVVRLASALLALGGMTVLLGWTLESAVLRSIVPGLVAMNPATAVLFLLTALTLGIHSLAGSPVPLKALRIAAAGFVTIAGASVLLGYCCVWRVGVDSVLFAQTLEENRMAPNTALYFVCTGLALLAIETRRVTKRASQLLALTVLGGSLISLLGYGYGATNLYGVGSYIPMALNTPLLFIVAAVGVFSLCAERGHLGFITGSGLGSAMARRLLPTAVVVPCILGFLRVWGQRAGLYETEFGAALMVVATVSMLLIAIVFTASALNRIDSERRLAMESLRASGEQIRDLYNNAPCGYHSLDGDGLIVAMNDTELRWLGYEREEVEGKLRLSDLLTPASRMSFDESLDAFESTGYMTDSEFEFVRKDGTVLPVALSAAARRDACGTRIASRYSVSDATERRRAEQAIRQLNGSLERRVEERTAELANANRDLHQKNQENEMFVYSVSHDLRSPLVNLQGFSKELDVAARDLQALLKNESVPESVQTKAVALLDGDVRQSLRFIQLAVTRLGNIIDALLRLSRVGRVEYQPDRVDLQALVIGVVETMSGALYDADVTVRVGELPPCHGDATALEQLFANLIGNAVKYRDPTRASVIDVGFEDQPSVTGDMTCTYYVRDNGLGIPASHQEKIFQAFKRAHPKVASGEGMGLAIVRRIVERHGGTAWVESQEKEGSAFFVTLPSHPSSRVCETPRTETRTGDADHGDRADGDLVGGRR